MLNILQYVSLYLHGFKSYLNKLNDLIALCFLDAFNEQNQYNIKQHIDFRHIDFKMTCN